MNMYTKIDGKLYQEIDPEQVKAEAEAELAKSEEIIADRKKQIESMQFEIDELEAKKEVVADRKIQIDKVVSGKLEEVLSDNIKIK